MCCVSFSFRQFYKGKNEEFPGNGSGHTFTRDRDLVFFKHGYLTIFFLNFMSSVRFLSEDFEALHEGFEFPALSHRHFVEAFLETPDQGLWIVVKYFRTHPQG